MRFAHTSIGDPSSLAGSRPTDGPGGASSPLLTGQAPKPALTHSELVFIRHCARAEDISDELDMTFPCPEEFMTVVGQTRRGSRPIPREPTAMLSRRLDAFILSHRGAGAPTPRVVERGGRPHLSRTQHTKLTPGTETETSELNFGRAAVVQI